MFDLAVRQRKAATMIAVLSEAIDKPLNTLSLLNVGGSAGIIDEYLSRYFNHVTGIDIDEKAVSHAKENFQKEGLLFEVGDGMNLKYTDNTFDVIVCSQVYEHVADAGKLMSEMYRTLKPGGVVYFAASNRIMWNEPHYDLPALSLLPKWLAHIYIRRSGKAQSYYETHFTYWGLRSLVSRFTVRDYTPLIMADPEKYKAGYMIPPGSRKQKAAVLVCRYAIWIMPGYIWLLAKPGDNYVAV